MVLFNTQVKLIAIETIYVDLSQHNYYRKIKMILALGIRDKISEYL